VAVALRGNVKDFGIAEVFQLIGQQRKTGILELSDRGEQIQLVFDRGAVVAAAPVGPRPYEALGEMLVRCGLLPRQRIEDLHRECAASAQTLPRLVRESGLGPEELEAIQDLLTRETIFQILRWEAGSFDFSAQEVEHGRSLDTLLGAEQILMDGLRMVDEWQSFADLVPSEAMVFRRSGDFEGSPRPEAGAQLEAARRVYRLVDGRMAVRRIIDISLLGSFDATRALAELRRAGAIEPLDAEDARRLQRRMRRSVKLRRPRVRGVVPALICLALLAAAVVAVARRAPAAPLPGMAMPRDAVAAARDAYATRGVRHALDAFRFVEGRWPQDLGEVRARGFGVGEALAGPQARPYYYAHREGAALLLAPERAAR
jgi:Domain of unknown function (DUF4388)